MTLLPLDNSVIFKKLFSNPEILVVFLKDLLGVEIDLTQATIETEKRFAPPVGAVDIALDIFVEDPQHRLIVEIQRVRYDYHYDRFLYYHQIATVELTKSHKNYKLDRAVHTIVWLTRPTRDPLHRHSLITTALCSTTERGEQLDIYPHKLYFLNPYYLNDQTPQGVADWLTLVLESIRHPRHPQLPNRPIIERAAQLIDESELTPQELAVYLEETGYEQNLQLNRQAGRLEERYGIARGILAKGMDLSLVSELTGLSLTELAELQQGLDS
jgi:predicted transposase/invertase (TIGR01784 family)